MGPRYSSDGAVQYALSQHVSKVVFDQSNVPGSGYIAAGPAALAAAAHTPITQLTENVPITDASSVALKEVNDAGPNGAVVLNFTPPQALVILQAAQKLGVENRVKLWGCSTPCNTDFLAQALGPKWNNKLFVNAEFTNPDDHNTPEFQLVLTDDIESTRRFYCDVVGLRVGERPPLAFPGYWLYAGATPCLHIAERGPYSAHAAAMGPASRRLRPARARSITSPSTRAITRL
jgi:hypothetical protein